MTYTQALEYIHSRPRFSKAPGLQVMKNLLDKIGNPQQKLKFVHIAGTNGKGSVTVMTASILQQAGYKVGMTISPYVLDFRERFQINGEWISEAALTQITAEIKEYAEEMETNGQGAPNEFELVTAAALKWFAQENCDIVCMETGLGGRLDATNAVENTLVACITQIGFDHTEVLGDTLAKITAEKCGIIKPGCTVINYPAQQVGVTEQIARCCEQTENTLCTPELDDFAPIEHSGLSNYVNYGGYQAELQMLGAHQALNASVAVECALALWRDGFKIEDSHIEAGLAAAKLPARIEVISREPLVVLDGAHNLDGAKALAQTLQLAKMPKLTFIMGVLKDKSSMEMIKALAPYMAELYTVTPDNPRALAAEVLAEQAEPYCQDSVPYDDLSLAIEDAKDTAKHGIVICGSLYLAAQARKILLPDEIH
ncbi:MAG: bifunctional folylpolyglutamate synthase/dihydrofolate synthase [Oscillospiraceae bacterium]|nr:bifunctional folylpolyglutamate synthase/dihydrofolate synthase [Oscillospiraceae bacterium]